MRVAEKLDWKGLKWTLPRNSRANVTYDIPVTVHCSYCTPDDGRGECPKHVE
jgi:hypothetical protein